ncbi:MAG: protoporphyrinogen oxidase [bacterium]
MKRIGIVGGGIAGLAAAFELLDASRGGANAVDVTVFESAPQPGGNIRTEEIDGYRVEWAVNGFLDNAPDTLALVERLGLSDRLVRANPAAARRFIYRGGRLHFVPVSPPAFFASPLLSIGGRLRVLGEPFVPARRAADGDESVFDFAARRIGAEAARVLVDAMVTGIFAGNARTLSLASTFPKMAEMEREHGGLVKAMLAKRRAARARPRGSAGGGPAGPGGHLTSFLDGMEELTRALAGRLGERLVVGADVESLTENAAHDGAASPAPRYALRFASGQTQSFDAVLLACPSWRAAELTAPLDADLSRHLGAIASAPVAVVALGYRLDDLGAAPDGFGYLIPRGEGLRPLGALFDSNLFPGRAPAGRALIRVLVGGAHEPALVSAGDTELLALARETLAAAPGIRATPVFTSIIRHARGIPQYTLGHAARVASIDDRLAAHPGLFVSGNSYHGVSVNACIAEARQLAGRVG